MGDNTKDIITIHIVNSVKGGCGKTAFSLFKAMELAAKEQGNSLGMDTKDAAVIWIDADFKGTASKVLFYGKDKESFQTINQVSIEKLLEKNPYLFSSPILTAKNRLCFLEEYVRYTLNDYLKENIREYEKLLIHGYVYNGGGLADPSGGKAGVAFNGMLDFIFASPNAEDKKLFDYGGIAPAIEIGRFTYLMKALMANLFEVGRTSTKAAGESGKIPRYKHIVLDMPPGDDAYAGALLSMLRQLAEDRMGAKDYGIKICLYMLSTSDRGHMYALTESLKEALKLKKSFKHTEEIYAVLGEIRSGEFVKPNLDIYINEIRKVSKIEQIPVILCGYQQEYYENCRSTNLMMKDFAYSIETL